MLGDYLNPPNSGRPKSASVASNRYAQTHKPTVVGALFSNQEIPQVEEVRVKKTLDHPAAKGNGDILSGIPAENPWKTTAQSFNDIKPKKQGKIPENKLSLTSPITGELLGNFGDWREIAEQERQKERNSWQYNRGVDESVDQSLLGRFRAKLVSNGARGIIGLGRKFKIIDDDRSNTISMDEFIKAVKECKLEGVSETEIRKLFTLFGKTFSQILFFMCIFQILPFNFFLHCRQRKNRPNQFR